MMVLLAVGAPALVRGATDATPSPSTELPFSRTSASLSASGAADRFRGGDDRLRVGSLSLRAETTLASELTLDASGARAWGILAGADARVFTTNLAGIAGDPSFFRLGLSLGAFHLSPARNLYTLHVGAFVAEQGALLDSPRVHPYAFALGTYRTSDELRLLYGLGYTYTYGRGLPLPLLGLSWRWAPSWRLDVLLPALARVTWSVNPDLSVAALLAGSGELARYRSSAPAAPDSVQELRIARLRLGVDVRRSLGRPWYVGVGGGVEGASIDDGLATRRAVGGWLQASIGYGRGTLSRSGIAEGDGLSVAAQ